MSRAMDDKAFELCLVIQNDFDEPLSKLRVGIKDIEARLHRANQKVNQQKEEIDLLEEFMDSVKTDSAIEDSYRGWKDAHKHLRKMAVDTMQELEKLRGEK